MAQIIGRYGLKKTPHGRAIHTGRVVTLNMRSHKGREERPLRPRRKTRTTR